MFRYCFTCATVAYSAAALRPGERCIRCESDRLAGTNIRCVPSPRAILAQAGTDVRWTSPAMLEWLGYGEDELHGRPLDEILTLRPGAGDTADVSEALSSRSAIQLEGEALSAGGRRLRCAVQAVPTHDRNMMLFVWDPREVPGEVS